MGETFLTVRGPETQATTADGKLRYCGCQSLPGIGDDFRDLLLFWFAPALYLARRHTISSTPAGAFGLVKRISAAAIAVTIRL